MDDKLDTIIYRIRQLERKVDLIIARREKATQRQKRERQHHPIYVRATDFMSNTDRHHAPASELRKYLQLDYHRRAVYRFMRRLRDGAFRPTMIVNEEEVFYDPKAQ